MGVADLASQTWTLIQKTLTICCARHPTSTTVRAFILPVVFMFFISYAKNFFVAPSTFGIGTPSPVKSLPNALRESTSGRHTVAFVNNGYTGGQIESVINEASHVVRSGGKKPRMLARASDLLDVCPSALRGTTPCYGAIIFHSSPTEGPNGIWNMSYVADGSLGEKIFVDQTNNDAEIYLLPFQHEIDRIITSMEGNPIPETIEQFPYTDLTAKGRARLITRLYQGTLLDILAVAFTIGVIGATYQLVGNMASERELGLSQLMEAMMPNHNRWEPQLVRLLSNHLSFDILYLPSWLVMGVIVDNLVFPETSIGILIVVHLLIGLSLNSSATFIGSLFQREQLSGITAVLSQIILAIIAQLGIGANGSTGAVAICSLLFPSMNYTFFIMYLARFQQKEMAANLINVAPDSPWKLSGILLWVFLIIQILVYPVLGAFVERSLYGTASRDRKISYESSNLEEKKVAVKLTEFSKHYSQGSWLRRMVLTCFRRKPKNSVVAVNGVNLDVLKGQIMILLGANGSGKSTTLDAIAGLNTITGGSIDIDMTAGGLGLCPQKNVLWDDLTVYEHIRIFNRLKTFGKKATKAENRELVKACDLEIKMNARASTLSGGQKRKLQLACMFTGSSSICLIDEVSSGIDPLARRKIWDILLRERGRRTIILTTHFLDEADVLSDHIVILSRGILKAEGPAVQLKNEFGKGYEVISRDSAFTPAPRFQDIPRYNDYDSTVYRLENSVEAAAFLSDMESRGFTDHQVHGPRVEDVFTELSDEIKEEYLTIMPPPSSESSHSDQEGKIQVAEGLNLKTGRGTSMFRQALVLFWKRCAVLQHNYLPYCAAVLVPIITAGLVTLFLTGFAPLSCNPKDQVSASGISNLTSNFNADVVYGPPGILPLPIVEKYYPAVNGSTVHTVESYSQFHSYIEHHFKNVTPGGFFLDPKTGRNVFAYVGNYNVALSVLVQNLVDNILGQTRIYASFQYFALPWTPSTGQTLQLILYFGLAMSAYPAFFALYPTAERLRKVRALQYSNGVRSTPLWLSYVVFDFIFVLVVSILSIALLVGTWGGWYYPGYLFVVFFLYGLCSIAFSHFVSLWVPSQLAAFAFAAGTQCVLFLLYFISYLSIITYAPTAQITHYITLAHFTIALVTPSGNLLRALLLTLNEFSLLCRGHSKASYPGDILVYGGPILYLLVQFFLLFVFVIWWDSGGRPSIPRKFVSKPKDIEQTTTQDPEIIEDLSRVKSSNDGLRVLNLTKAFKSNIAVDNVTFGIKRSEVFALLGPNGAGKSTTISLIRGDIRPSTKSSDVIVDGASISTQRIQARKSLGVCPQFDAMDKLQVASTLTFFARIRGVPDVAASVQSVMRAVGLTQYANRMAGKLSGGNKRKLSLAVALIGNPSVLLLDEPSSGMDAAAKRVMWRVLGAVKLGRALLITTHSMEEADALAERAGIIAGRMLALGSTQQLRAAWGNAYHVHLMHRDAPHTAAADMRRVRAWIKSNIAGAVVEERGEEELFHGGQMRFRVPNNGAAAGDGETSSESGTSSEKDEIRKAGVSATTPQQRQGIAGLFNLLESNKEALGLSSYTISPTTFDQVFLNVVQKHNVEEENYKSAHGKERGRAGWFTKLVRRR